MDAWERARRRHDYRRVQAHWRAWGLAIVLEAMLADGWPEAS